MESIFKADIQKTRAMVMVVFAFVSILLIMALFGIISNLYITGDLFSIQRLWGHFPEFILPLIFIWVLYRAYSVIKCYPYIKMDIQGFEIKTVWVQSILWTEIQSAQLKKLPRLIMGPVPMTSNNLYLLIKLKDYKEYRAQNPFYLRVLLDNQLVTLEDGESFIAMSLVLYADSEEILNEFKKYLATYGY